jgi:hypothetical protein
MLTVGSEDYNTHQICTTNYRAPELFADLENPKEPVNGYGQSIDLWSLGAVMSEFITGVILFDGRSDLVVLREILSRIPVTAEELKAQGLGFMNPAACNQTTIYRLHPLYDDKLQDTAMIRHLMLMQNMIESVLVLDPTKRATAEQVINHEFFGTLRGPDPQEFPLHLSGRYGSDPHYLPDQTRRKFVDYILAVCAQHRLNQQTALLSILLFDRYICAVKPNLRQRGSVITLICKSLLYLVSRYVDIDCINVKVLIQSGTCTADDITACEREILSALRYRIQYATLLDLYRNLRGEGKSPSEAEWAIMCDLIRDYENLRGKGTADLMQMLRSKLKPA